MKQIDLSKLKVNSFRSRKSKVDRSQLAVHLESKGLATFIDSLPDILKGARSEGTNSGHYRRKAPRQADFVDVRRACDKSGISPVLCEIMQKGICSANLNQQCRADSRSGISLLRFDIGGRGGGDYGRTIPE